MERGLTRKKAGEIKGSLDNYLKTGSIKDYLASPQDDIKDYLKVKPANELESYLHKKPSIKSYLNRQPIKKVSKTAVERVSSVISEDDDDLGGHVRKITRIVKEEVGEENTITNKGVYHIISTWISSNWRQIVWNVVWSSIVVLAIGIAYVSFTAGSWFLLLKLLKHLGLKVIPQALFSALGKAGFSIGATVTIDGLIGLAKKNDRLRGVLEKEVSVKYLSSVAQKLGINLSDRVKSEDILKMTINTGTSLGISGLNGYLISTGISFGMRKTTETVSNLKKKMRNVVSDVSKLSTDVKKTTAMSILNLDPKPIVQTVVEDIENSAPRRLSRIESSVNKVRDKTEISQTTENVIGYNKLLTAATITSIALASIGLANTDIETANILKEQLEIYGQDAMSKLGSSETIGKVISTSFNFARESKYLKILAAQYLLEKIGVNAILDSFSDYLIPREEAKLRSLNELIKKEKSKSKLAKLSAQFLTILSGGNYHDIESLEALSIIDLRNIYRGINPKDIAFSKYTKIQLQGLILSKQKGRRLMVAQLLNTAMKTGLKTAAASITYEVAVEGYSFAKASLEEIEREALNLSKGIEERELSQEEASRLKEERKLQVEMEKGLRKREISELEAKKLKIEQKERVSEIKKEREARRSLEESKEVRFEKALERLRERMEEKKLEEALKLEEISKRMNIVIATDDGISHPIPSDDVLLDKNLQKVLDLKVTPLFEYLTKEAAKASTSWVPGIGWIQAGIQKINVGLTVAETTKNVGKILEVLTKLDKGETDIEPILGNLDQLLGMRLPSLNSIVDEAIKTSEINLKELVLRKLKDKFIEGWDNQRVAYEIGKELIGPGENFGVDITQDFGERIWNKLW